MIFIYIAISFVVLYGFATILDFDLYKAIFVPAIIIGFLYSINGKLNKLTTHSEEEIIEAFKTKKLAETEQAETEHDKKEQAEKD
jgi:cell shape-determining protein MreC